MAKFPHCAHSEISRPVRRTVLQLAASVRTTLTCVGFASFTCLGVNFRCASSALAGTSAGFSTENEWSSPQINALGGVGLMSEDVVDQFFSDPTAAARRKATTEIQWTGLHVQYSRELASTITDFQTILKDSSGDSKSASKTIDILNGVRNVFGRSLTAGLNMSVLATRIKKVTVVPYLSGFANAGVNVPSWPRANGIVDGYLGLGMGYSHTFGKDFDVGMNLRPGVRTYAAAAVDVSSVGDFSDSSSASSSSSSSSGSSKATAGAVAGAGFYVPVDLAAGYQLGQKWRTTFVLRNVGGAPAFSLLQGDKPPVYPMRVSLGVVNKAYDSGAHKVNWGTELQDMMNLGKDKALWFRWQLAAQYLYRLSFRTQTSFGLHTGLRSGYPAVGIFLDAFFVRLEGTYYVRENGIYVGQRPTRMLSFKLSSQLSF